LAGASKAEKLHSERLVKKAAAKIDENLPELIIEELHRLEKEEEKAKEGKKQNS